ncbi:MAG TPA: septation protein SepH [Motilibacteraceae bacterium]|nr:septation protein SepH [Motilibacteraceae bacterium]
MRDLSLVALHEDGESLVLEDAEGGRYSLAVDERLLSAVRGDRARLGQLSIELESSLRPAEIQARIRAGATAEEVAREAGVPLERVRRYEGPVVAEREHVARLARAALVGRRDGGERAPLAEVVEPRLARRGVPAEAVGWDAYRRDDGRWVVAVRWTTSSPGQGKSAAGSATWLFDVRTRALSPGGDEARWLVDGEPAELAADVPPAAHPRSPEEFAERAYDEAPSEESPFPRGEAIAPVSEPGAATGRDDQQVAAPAAEEVPGGATVVGLDALLEAGSSGRRGRRGRRDRGARPEQTALGHSQPDGSEESDRGRAGAAPETARPPAGGPAPAEPRVQAEQPAHGTEPDLTGGPDEAGPEPEGAAVAEAAEVAEAAPGRASRPAAGSRGRRAAVPSWDEIVFGRKSRD